MPCTPKRTSVCSLPGIAPCGLKKRSEIFQGTPAFQFIFKADGQLLRGQVEVPEHFGCGLRGAERTNGIWKNGYVKFGACRGGVLSRWSCSHLDTLVALVWCRKYSTGPEKGYGFLENHPPVPVVWLPSLHVSPIEIVGSRKVSGQSIVSRLYTS